MRKISKELDFRLSAGHFISFKRRENNEWFFKSFYLHPFASYFCNEGEVPYFNKEENSFYWVKKKYCNICNIDTFLVILSDCSCDTKLPK